MKIDVPTLLYVVYILFFIGLFVFAGILFGFHFELIAFLVFIVLVIGMIALMSRAIREPEAK